MRVDNKLITLNSSRYVRIFSSDKMVKRANHSNVSSTETPKRRRNTDRSAAPEDYPYSCSECNQGCKSTQGLTKHMQARHANVIPQSQVNPLDALESALPGVAAILQRLTTAEEQDRYEETVEVDLTSLLPVKNIRCPATDCSWTGTFNNAELCDHVQVHFPDLDYSLTAASFLDYPSQDACFNSHTAPGEKWGIVQIDSSSAIWRCQESLSCPRAQCTAFFHYTYINEKVECTYCMTHTGHSRPGVVNAAEREEREPVIPAVPSAIGSQTTLRAMKEFDRVYADVFKHGIELSENRYDTSSFENFMFMISRICDIHPGPTVPKSINLLERNKILYGRFVELLMAVRDHASKRKDNDELHVLRERIRSQIGGFPVDQVVIKKRIQYTQGETRQVPRMLTVKPEPMDEPEEDYNEDVELNVHTVDDTDGSDANTDNLVE